MKGILRKRLLNAYAVELILLQCHIFSVRPINVMLWNRPEIWLNPVPAGYPTLVSGLISKNRPDI